MISFQRCIESTLWLMLLLFLLPFRCTHREHPATFHLRHTFQCAKFSQAFGKLQDDQLPALLELDSPALELYIGFYLVTILQEAFRMFCLEVEIVIIRVWGKTDFFHFGDLAL